MFMKRILSIKIMNTFLALNIYRDSLTREQTVQFSVYSFLRKMKHRLLRLQLFMLYREILVMKNSARLRISVSTLLIQGKQILQSLQHLLPFFLNRQTLLYLTVLKIWTKRVLMNYIRHLDLQ